MTNLNHADICATITAESNKKAIAELAKPLGRSVNFTLRYLGRGVHFDIETFEEGARQNTTCFQLPFCVSPNPLYKFAVTVCHVKESGAEFIEFSRFTRLAMEKTKLPFDLSAQVEADLAMIESGMEHFSEITELVDMFIESKGSKNPKAMDDKKLEDELKKSASNMLRWAGFCREVPQGTMLPTVDVQLTYRSARKFLDLRREHERRATFSQS